MPETVPLHLLMIPPHQIPAPEVLPQDRRNGWACVFCGDPVGGAAPIHGRIELGNRLACCFACMRHLGKPVAA